MHLPSLIGLLATALSAPAFAQATTGEEPLLGAEVKAKGIEFKVPTGGCTSKENFGLETIERHPLTVRLFRIRPDYCEAFLPKGIKINFTFAEIGIGPVLDEPERKKLVILNAMK